MPIERVASASTNPVIAGAGTLDEAAHAPACPAADETKPDVVVAQAPDGIDQQRHALGYRQAADVNNVKGSAGWRPHCRLITRIRSERKQAQLLVRDALLEKRLPGVTGGDVDTVCARVLCKVSPD